MTRRLDKIAYEVSNQISDLVKQYDKEDKYLGDLLDEKVSLSIRDVEYLIQNTRKKELAFKHRTVNC